MDKEHAGGKARAGAIRGRGRPAYQPKNIRCEGCGAGLSVKDERAELVVCEYCGSHLDVSATEGKVVGRKTDSQPFFPFQLGDSFHYQSARFEVIARLAYIEDGEVGEMTREYLLYHPRRPSRWLGEYQGNYSLTSTSHVMPQKDAFKISRGGKLRTHDGKAWICEGRGTYVFSDGSKYVGDFVKNQRHGEGRYVYVGGEEYVGPFINGKKEGEGSLIYPNGRQIRAVWKQDSFVRLSQP